MRVAERRESSRRVPIGGAAEGEDAEDMVALAEQLQRW